MPMLTVRLLGVFEVTCKKRIVHIPGRMAQSLFAYLILNKGVAHRREKLATMLWADSPAAAARENLRHTLWQIRKAFGQLEHLETDDLSVTFRASADLWLDADILKTAAKKKRADDLLPVLAVCQGELLPGFYEDWITLEREYLSYVFEHNMARLLAMLQTEKRWLDILEWSERWLAFGQKPEPAYRALMLAHKEEGEMPKVAETYARCLRDLGEIGLAPSEQTQELFETLKQTPSPRYGHASDM
jgi:DNA-binding SARP family transcriptional activator